MTVAEIKEYIDEWKEYYKSYAFIGKGEVDKTLDEIKGLLDELEPKEAHYIEIDNRIDETEPLEYRCSKCRRTFYFEDVDKYCCKCGARMTNAKEILGE